MKVSIITPSLNSEKYIENCLKSIHLDQKGDFSLEHIIVDGDSTDRTIEIVEAFKKEHKANIRIIRGKDKSVFYALNKGLKAMTGDIWACLNTDDLYYPGVINFVIEEFGKNPDVEVIYGSPDMIDENGKFLDTVYLPKFDLEFFVLKRYPRTIIQPAVFLRKRVFDMVGYFDTDYRYASDYDYFIRLGSKCKMKLIRKSFAKYRMHSSAITRNEKTQSVQKEEAILISKKYMDLLKIKQRSVFFDNLSLYFNQVRTNNPKFVLRSLKAMLFSKSLVKYIKERFF